MAKARNKTLEWDAKSDTNVLAELAEPSPIEEALKETTAVAEPRPEPAKDVTPPAAAANPPETKAASRPVAIVPIEVFRQVSGVKPDQFAGFAWYAKRRGLKPQPVAGWRREYERFLKRTV